MTLHATPFLDGVLVSGRTHDEQERREGQLTQAQRLAGLGTWQWDVGSATFDCSPEVYRLLGIERPDAAGTLSVALAAATVAPADRRAVRRRVEQLRSRQLHEAAMEFRIRPADGRARSVRAVAERIGGSAPGEALAIRGVVQDVTAWRQAEKRLADTRARLADQVRQTAAEHQMVGTLQRALMNVASGPSAPRLESAARYLPAETDSQVGGDRYDMLTLPDGMVLVVVGDVSGHGLRAAAGMAQLRDTLRGMAFVEADPATTLARLNQLLCHLGSDFVATVVCGRLDSRRRTLTWARSGHLPPLLVRDGVPRYLRSPAGPLLGAIPDGVYRDAVLHLEPGDRVLLFTDGLVERRGEDLTDGLGRLAEAVREYRAPGLEGCLDHVLRRLALPNPKDDACLLALRLE